MKPTINFLLKVLRDISIGFGAIVGFAITAFELGQRFGLNFDWLKSFGIFGIYQIIIHALLGGLIYSLIMIARRDAVTMMETSEKELKESVEAQKLFFELAKVVKDCYKNKNYVEVVRFGSQLSRPLWLSGMYAERIMIGLMIEDSAARVGMYEEQILALIDDLGWTNAVMGNLDKAVGHINHGIELAKDKGLFYYAAKGERHLAFICERYSNDISKSEAHFEGALKLAEKIQDVTFREEMQGGIYYGQAELFFRQGRYEEAFKLATDSKELYERIGGQEERLVKSRSQLGRILLEMNDTQKALDMFRIGLKEAQGLMRKDETAINLLGIGEVHVRNKEFDLAIDAFTEAINLFDELGMKQESKKTKELRLRAELEQRVNQE